MLRKFLSLLSVLFVLADVAAEKLPEVSFITPSVARIRWSAEDSLRDNLTGATVYGDSCFTVRSDSSNGKLTYSTSELTVVMDRATGALVFKDAATGKVLLAEDAVSPRTAQPVAMERVIYDDATARMEDTANGSVTVKDVAARDTVGTYMRYVNRFNFTPDEALYGLGSHMEDYMNLNGKTLYLVQHNLKIYVPVLISTRGYGLMFDAGCAMKFDKGAVTYEGARSIDYYFMKGDRMEDVVADRKSVV